MSVMAERIEILEKALQDLIDASTDPEWEFWLATGDSKAMTPLNNARGALVGEDHIWWPVYRNT